MPINKIIEKYTLKLYSRIRHKRKLFNLSFEVFIDKLQDVFQNIFFSCRCLLVQIYPKTIRFKLLTSYIFLKIRKKFFYTPRFFTKKIGFYSIEKIEKFIDDIILYFKEIFILHWKLTTLIITLCIILCLIEKTSLESIATSLVNSPKQDKLFDFYSTLATIVGTFLGLYFAAISIIAQTIYSKVNGEINKLLNSIRLSNVYIKSIVILLAVLLVSIFMMTQNIKLDIFNCYIVFIFSFISLISFWELASYIFLFFNPSLLIRQYIIPEILKNIELTSDSLLYKYDKNFQNHTHKITYNTFNTYDSIVEFAIKQDLLQTNVIADIVTNSFYLLSKYILSKSKIPTNSFWFPQTYEFKKYITSDFSAIELSQKTGTIINPNIIHDNMWFEERIMTIINKCLMTLFEKNKYETCYVIINKFSQYLEILNSKNKTDEVFFLLDKLYNPFKMEKIKQCDNKFYVYGSDEYISLYISLILSFNPNVLKNEICNITAQNIIKHKIIHNKNNLPNNIKIALEDLNKKLNFELLVEKQIITTDWHIKNLLLDKSLEYVNDFYNKLVDKISKDINLYSDDEFVKNNPIISTTIFNRTYEFCHKLTNSLNSTQAIFNNDKAFEILQKKVAIIKNKLLKLIIKIDPYLTHSDKQTPDYIGFAYIVLYDEIKQIILNKQNKNDEILGDLFFVMYHLVELQTKDIVTEINDIIISNKPQILIDNHLSYYLNKSHMFFIELMDLSGYLYLFDDVYGKKFKDLIIPFWNNIIQKRGIEFLCNVIISYQTPSLQVSKFSHLGFALKQEAKYKLQELDLLYGSPDDIFIKRKDIKPEKSYSSKLLENICYRDTSIWEAPDGYIIFIVLYLLNNCTADQKAKLLDNYKIKHLYNEAFTKNE